MNNSLNRESKRTVEPMYSLIIPCYNESMGLPELINRCNFLVNSTNGEVILVDNGSSDGSLQIMTELLEGNRKVRYVRVEKNLGYGHGILTGLTAARAPIIGWTHADLQTDPLDLMRAIPLFTDSKNRILVKGTRFGRRIADRFFTAGMSVFETILTGKVLRDINAQPTMFSRELIDTWGNPPTDFSLDLFAMVQAHKNGYEIRRFPVLFASRKHGTSSWNTSFASKWKFIKRTLLFSLNLRKRL